MPFYYRKGKNQWKLARKYAMYIDRMQLLSVCFKNGFHDFDRETAVDDSPHAGCPNVINSDQIEEGAEANNHLTI